MAIDVGSAIAYLDLDTSKFKSGLSSALSSLNSFADSSLSASSRIGALGSAISTTGSTLTRTVTLPLATAGTAATKLASDFEASMSKVEAISGSTADEMVDLRNKAIEMGAKTKFSAKESADAFTYMAMAGWDAGQMIDGISGIMSLAAADGLDLATTSDIVTDALTAFGLEAKDSAHFADVLAQASSSANTNVSMLGESFKYIGPVAGTLGYSVEDISLGLGLMANSGIKASQAGTSFRTALTNLVKPTDKMVDKMVELGLATQETARVYDQGKIEKAQLGAAEKTLALEKAQTKYNEAVAKYGANSTQAQSAALKLQKAQLSLTEANTKLSSAQQGSIEVTGIQSELLSDSTGQMKPLREVLVTLREAFAGLSEEEQANAAATLFGKEAMSGMLAIINASEEDFNKLADAIDNSDGKAEEMAEIMMDNLAGAIEQLMGALESLAIKFGTALTPTIRSLAEWLTALVEKLNTLSDAQVEQIVKIAAIAAALGPVLLILGKVVMSIKSIVDVASSLPAIGVSFTAIGSALLPILAVAGAVVGLIAVFKKLYEENEEFRTSLTNIWGGISTNVTGVISTLQEAFSKFKESLSVIPETLEATFDSVSPDLGNSVINLIQSIRQVFQLLQPVIEQLAEVFGGIFLTTVSAIAGALNGLLNALSPLLDVVSSSIFFFVDLANAIGALLSGDYEGFAENIQYALWDVEEGVKNLIEAIVSFVTGFVEGFWTTLKELFGAFGIDVQQFFTDVWNSIVEFFTGIKDSIVGFVTGLGESLVNFVTVTIPEFIESVKEWFNNLPYYISFAIGAVLGVMYQFGVDLIAWVTEDIPAFIDKVGEFFMTLPDRISTWLDETIPKVIEWATNLKNQASEAGQGFIDSITTFFEELPDKFSAWLEDAIDKFSDFLDDIKEAGKELIESLGEGLKEAWEDILDWFDGIGETLTKFWQGIKDGFSSVTEAAESVQGSVSGSHANGLSYVPYNGYVAELHQGERVLTKEEAKEYNLGRNQSGGNVYNFYGTEKLDQRETEAAFERMLREFDLLTT